MFFNKVNTSLFKSAAICFCGLIFLLFSYCPVRQVIQTGFHHNTAAIPNTKPGAIKTYTYHICSQIATEEYSSQKSQTSKLAAITFAAVAIFLFYTYSKIFVADVFYKGIACGNVKLIPIYLKNRVLIV